MTKKEKCTPFRLLIFLCALVLSVTKSESQVLSLQSSLSQGLPFKSGVLFTDGQTLLSSAQFQTDILPQSPEAAAMVKYTLLPVTLYSGLPQVGVPLFDIKTPNLDVPVSLSYNYNGFKPAETASDVGLGWNVQGAGVITRIVKSRVDHLDSHVIGNDYDNYINMNLMAFKQTILQNMGLALMDGEPDLYVFNAPGLSGKFIMMQGKAYMFPYQNIQIQSLGTELGFVITNEKGDRYFFQNGEESHHQQTSQFGEYIPDHMSAFFLSSIVSADLTDTIQYAYNSYTYQQPPNYSQTLTTTIDAGASISRTTVISQNFVQSPSNGDYIDALTLASISSKNERVVFNMGSTPRQDIFALNGTMYPLTSVAVYSSLGSVLSKQFNLVQNYFNGKLNLTEVDETTPLSDGMDSAELKELTQKYQFQYLDPQTGVTSVPGWNNLSVDHWGYYNGAVNQMLFTSDDIAYSSTYPLGNRDADEGYCQTNALSQVTYPTGGYSTFTYELNQTGHYVVEPTPIPDGSSTTLYYSDSTVAAVNGVKTATSSFILSTNQTIAINYYDKEEGGNEDVHPVVTINSLTGAVLYTSQPLSDNVPSRTDSLYLPAGTYRYTVDCDSGVFGEAVNISFVTYAIDNTLVDGPGIRVNQISSYDGINTAPALVKHYAYNFGTGFYNGGVHATSVLQHGDLCSRQSSGDNCPAPIDQQVISMQASLNEPINDLVNSLMYYQNVEETEVGPNINGKTDYVFNCFAPVDPDVFLQQKTDYGYVNGQYVSLKQTTSNYSQTTRFTFQTLTSTVSDQMLPNTSGCYYCQELPTPDQTQPVAGLINEYSATHNQLSSGYKSLTSTVDVTWDQNGLNPLSSETDYYYDNASYLFPTRIITHDSKGEQVTTQLKYPLDYPVAGATTQAGLDSAFTTSENSVVTQYNTCTDNLFTALTPYQPYSLNSTNFTTVANSYNCEGSYQTASQTAFTSRNSNWTSYLSGLASAEASDTSASHEALYWMQANNIISPVIEKYVSVIKSDGNEYLLSASRNNYSLLTNASGQMVAKQTGLQLTELNAPILKSSFLTNLNGSYRNEVSMAYDSNLKMTSQSKVNDIAYHYLWGYNHQFVVAEVEGSSQATIAGFVNQAILDNPPDPVTLRTELAKIRTGLASVKAMVTTCTYDPLVGITSKTDPAGRTIYYDYDVMGRLVDVKDQDSNIIKTFNYHYQQ